MAKKGKRRFVRFICQNKRDDGKICKNKIDTLTTTNVQNTPIAELPLRKKFCTVCRKSTSHKISELKKQK